MIVGFLQNAWFRPGTKQVIIDRFWSDHKFRRALIARSASGKRLTRTFDKLFAEIYWQDATREIGYKSSAKLPADDCHIQQVLNEQCPSLVLAFGELAGAALTRIWPGPLICLPHPAARGLKDELYREAIKLINMEVNQRVKLKITGVSEVVGSTTGIRIVEHKQPRQDEERLLDLD